MVVAEEGVKEDDEGAELEQEQVASRDRSHRRVCCDVPRRHAQQIVERPHARRNRPSLHPCPSHACVRSVSARNSIIRNSEIQSAGTRPRLTPEESSRAQDHAEHTVFTHGTLCSDSDLHEP